ncbi:IclR family transcriptional regulator [Sphingobium sp. YR768]|jgi:DNA-binding IclR family transcriptional regulator|uniref:IclR family transcriptional regulator n=1 Tax=Sphingobium sp. YR768 TaxID=1884365 RepID=UPI0008CAECBA|nr:helix-turn-helix domain-containing protein [Sphingobium sp. YR768]SER88763.1 transcriptional regulator, IclR family [Sphingobium sp. YR768]
MATDVKDRPALEGVAALERGLLLLTCFKQGDGVVGLAELAERTGLVKSTILRLAVSLERYNLIVRMPDGQYQLGSEVARLNSVFRESNDLERHIQPILAKLAVETEETATFYVRQGDVRLCLFRVNSPSSLRLDVQPGTQRPLDGSASAQLLQLFEQWPDVKPDLPPLPIYTSGVTTPHVASMSVPVIGHGDRLIGALSLAGPEVRLSEGRARLPLPLLQAGLALCRSLGGDAEAIYRVPIALAT